MSSENVSAAAAFDGPVKRIPYRFRTASRRMKILYADIRDYRRITADDSSSSDEELGCPRDFDELTGRAQQFVNGEYDGDGEEWEE